MENFRTCEYYPSLKCNCGGDCLVKKCELEEEQKQQEASKRMEQDFQMLLDFLIYLRDLGLIKNEDWYYEDKALEFLNQNRYYERD